MRHAQNQNHGFLLILFAGTLLFSQTPQWSKEAQKLQNSIHALDTLLSVNPFPDDVPGLDTAITNKTGQLMADLAALKSALETEMATLTPAERQEALDVWAELMIQIADLDSQLYVRGFDVLTLDLVDSYNAARTSYFSLIETYSLTFKRLPIGTRLQDGGGMVPW